MERERRRDTEREYRRDREGECRREMERKNTQDRERGKGKILKKRENGPGHSQSMPRYVETKRLG